MLPTDILLSERKAALTVRAGKSGKQRSVPLNSEVRRFLEEWLSVRPEAGSEMLFIGQRGEPMQARSAQIAVVRYAKQAGLEGVTPHILRHTFAKSLLDNGVSLEKVAALLGHESLDTTRIYVRYESSVRADNPSADLKFRKTSIALLTGNEPGGRWFIK